MCGAQFSHTSIFRYGRRAPGRRARPVTAYFLLTLLALTVIGHILPAGERRLRWVLMAAAWCSWTAWFEGLQIRADGNEAVSCPTSPRCTAS
jgi:hypothetical protein